MCIRDRFRAWAAASERSDSTGTSTPQSRPQSLARLPSSLTISSAWSSAGSETSETPSVASRPSLSSYSSAATVYTMGTNRSRPHAARKRKHRTVNLRKSTDTDISDTASVATNYSGSASASNSAPSITVTEPPATPVNQQSEFGLQTPGKSPHSSKVRFQQDRAMSFGEHGSKTAAISTPRKDELAQYPDPDTTPRPSRVAERRRLSRQQTQPQPIAAPAYSEKRPSLSRSLSTPYLDGSGEGFTGGILEQAWIAKMQVENKRRAQWEKASRASTSSFWDKVEGEQSPPPAYAM